MSLALLSTKHLCHNSFNKELYSLTISSCSSKTNKQQYVRGITVPRNGSTPCYLKFRFRFNACLDTVQEPMIRPAFLSGGVEEPQLREISFIS